jgi:hypothetical protein
MSGSHAGFGVAAFGCTISGDDFFGIELVQFRKGADRLESPRVRVRLVRSWRGVAAVKG